MTKHRDQKAVWGERGLFDLCILNHNPLSEAKVAGTQTGQEPGGRSRGHGEGLHTALLPMACSACFLIQPGTTSPWLALPTMGWAFSYQSLVKKTVSRLACSQFLWRHFLSHGSVLSEDYSLCQLDTVPLPLSSPLYLVK